MDFETILNNVINELNNQTDDEISFNIFFQNIGDDLTNVLNNSFNEDKYVAKKTCPEFLNNLNEQIITNELIEQDIHCSICLDNFKVGDKYIELPCEGQSHYFHNGDSEKCSGILPWLKENNTCPICRHEFPEKVEEEEKVEKIQDLPTSNTDLSQNDLGGNIVDEINRLLREINDLDDETRLQHALMSSINEK